jgi:hypothetical protein
LIVSQRKTIDIDVAGIDRLLIDVDLVVMLCCRVFSVVPIFVVRFFLLRPKHIDVVVWIGWQFYLAIFILSRCRVMVSVKAIIVVGKRRVYV